MSNRLAVVSALFAAAMSAALAPSAPAAGVTKEKFDEVAKKLQANAKLWMEGKEIPAADRADTNAVSFDKDSVKHLVAWLKTAKRDTASLYATDKLLDRLRHAKAETVVQALPAIESLQGRVQNAYRPPPRYSRAQVKSLKLPPYRKSISTQEIMARVGVLEKRRDEKVARELPMAKHNEVVWAVERDILQMLLMANDNKRDDTLVRILVNAERRGQSRFITISDMLAGAAPKMGKDRAEAFHKRLKSHATRLRMQGRKQYSNPGKIQIRRDDASGYEQKNDYAGIRLLNTLNKLAATAKQPAIKVPTPQQVDEYNQKKKGR